MAKAAKKTTAKKETVESVEFLPLRNSLFRDFPVRTAKFTDSEGDAYTTVADWVKKGLKGHVGTLARQTENGGGVVAKYNAGECRLEFRVSADDLRAFADELDASNARSMVLVAVSEFALGEKQIHNLETASAAATKLTAAAQKIADQKANESKASQAIIDMVDAQIAAGSLDAASRDAKIAELAAMFGA
jgi:hypothetical protein